jgi:DNA polymerase-3 subunit gamma/tau
LTKQALYLKWRPETFDDVIGQEHVTRTLHNSIESGRIRHAYLFSGPRGTGKTTTARLLAHTLGSQNMDLIEIDAASHTGVDDVRELRDKIAFMPAEGQYKVYIIDEVHRFSGSAFDALLKTLEEPPDHAIFVLATTEIDKVPETIKSRCLQFEFRRVALREVADRLQMIADAEGLNIDRDALELIARQGTGSVRDSISLLDQIVADPQEHITLALTQRLLGTANNEAVLQLADAIFQGDVAGGLSIINQAVDAGSDPRQFGQQLVEHLRYVLLAQTASADLIEATDEMQQVYAQQASQVTKGTLLRAIRTFNDAVNDQRSGWHPQLALELALVEGVRASGGGDAPAVDLTDIEAQVEQMIEARLATLRLPPADHTSAEVPPPAPANEHPPTEAEPGAPSAVPLSQIRAKWNETRKAIKSKNKILEALLEHVEVRGVSGDMVTLTVQNEVFLERLNTTDHRSLLSYVLKRLHDAPLQVRIIMAERASGAADDTSDVDVDDPVLQAGKELGGHARPYHDKHD